MTHGFRALPVLSLLLISGAIHWALYSRRKSIFFGVRVESTYYLSQEGRGTWQAFFVTLWLLTVAVTALTVLVLSNAMFLAATLTPLLLVAGVSVAYRWAFLRTLPHALPAATARTASLAVEPEAGLPGGWLVAGGPFVLLAGVALYLKVHWNEIPERFPIHWGLDGRPNGWSNRTVAGVFWPLALAAAIDGLMAWFAWYALQKSRRSKAMTASVQVLVATAWFMAVVFGIAALTPLLPGPPPTWAIFVAIGAFIGLTIWLSAKAAAAPSDEPSSSEEFWKWGQFYYNPNDSALFVEKRFGIGYTLNFAHRAAWIFMGAVIGLPLLAVVFSIWH